MAKAGTRLGKATYVARGYGQVEPNLMTAKRNGQVYAQLPAHKDIEMLENGQFVKYDYAAGVCNFTGEGPWRMVYNEVKVYRDYEGDADFAMIKQDYNARVYSPIGQNTDALKPVVNYGDEARRLGTNEPFVLQKETFTYPQMMPEGTKMVPRVIAVPVGDIFTTNTIMLTETWTAPAKDEILGIGADGYLTKKDAAGGDADPKFKIVKVYTMPDMQPGVKLQRIA